MNLTATWACRYDYITHYCTSEAEAQRLCAEFRALDLPAVVVLLIRGAA